MVALFEKLRRKEEKWRMVPKSRPVDGPHAPWAGHTPRGQATRLPCSHCEAQPGRTAPGNGRPRMGQARGLGHIPSQLRQSCKHTSLPTSTVQGARPGGADVLNWEL